MNTIAFWFRIYDEVHIPFACNPKCPVIDLSFSEKNKERATLSSYASQLSPELRSCEHWLACRIEGLQQDRLLIRFSEIDPTDLERDASFVLDMSSQNFKGLSSLPRQLSPNISLMLYSDNGLTASAIHGNTRQHP